MKFNKITLIQPLLIGSLLLMGACKEEFFNQTPYDSVPVDKAITNETEMQAAVNGMYSGLRNVDLYGRTFPVVGDVMADNVYVSAQNAGRYITHYTYSVLLTTAEPAGTWTSAYTAILRANNIINALVTETATSKQLKGEALATRGLLYFDLLRTFANTTDPNALGVPLVTQFDQNLKPSRPKVSEVYAQIIKDLTQAYGLMTVSKNSSYMTKYAAKAILAKVYLYQGDYKNAQAAAEDVVKNGGFTLAAPTALVAYWKNATPRTDKVETIFEVSFDGVSNLGTNALAYMYEQSGYGDLLATTNLYNQYADTDVRKLLITPGKRGGQDALIVGKYSNTSNANDKDDTKILRYADVLLILAEAQYRNGDETAALATLNQLATRRDPAFTGYKSTGAALLNDIITERRKELAFEGDRLYDLNRLNLSIDRGVQYPTASRTIEAKDTRRIAPIPQVEIDANPAIQQNPGY